jgi:hypothetical protein
MQPWIDQFRLKHKILLRFSQHYIIVIGVLHIVIGSLHIFIGVLHIFIGALHIFIGALRCR